MCIPTFNCGRLNNLRALPGPPRSKAPHARITRFDRLVAHKVPTSSMPPRLLNGFA